VIVTYFFKKWIKKDNYTKSISDLYLNLREEIKYSVTPKFIDFSANVKDLAELATEVWKIEQRSNKLISKLSEDKKKGFESSINRLKMYLTKNDIEVVDYSNQKYNEGLNLDILSIEKKTKLEAPMIKSTIEPTILYKGQVFKKAKVILQSK